MPCIVHTPFPITSLATNDDGGGGDSDDMEDPAGTEGDNEAEAEAEVEVEAGASAEDEEDEEDGADAGDRWSVVNVQHPTRIERSISSSPVNARASPMIVPACETSRIRSCPTPTSYSLLYSSRPVCDAIINEGGPASGTDLILQGGRTRIQRGTDLPLGL